MNIVKFATCFAALGACGDNQSGVPAGPPDAAPASPEVDGGPDQGAAYAEAVWNARWTELPNAPVAPGGAKMDDIFFVSPKVGFVANGPGFAIAKTEDSGATWTNAFQHDGTYFRAVAFVDDRHGFAGNLGAGLSSQVDDTNVLYETKDGGATWAPVGAITGPNPSGICNLTVIDKEHIVAVGRANGPSHLLTSKDGGASWASTDLGSYLSMAIDAHFTSPNEGVVVGMGAGKDVCTVIRTTDGGKTFSSVFESKTPTSLCWKVQFPTADVGFVAVQDTTSGPATLAKTIDGGKSWTEMVLPVKGAAKGAYPMIGVGFIDEKIGWIAPEEASLHVYRTRDGGETWEVDPTLKAPINRFRFVEPKTAYAIGGQVWKLSIEAP